MENISLILGIIASVVTILGGAGYIFINNRNKNIKINSGDNSMNIIGDNNQVNKDLSNEE